MARANLKPLVQQAVDAVLVYRASNSLPEPTIHSQAGDTLLIDFVADGGVFSMMFTDDYVHFAHVGKGMEGRVKVVVEEGKIWKVVDRFALELNVLLEIGFDR